MEDMVIPIIIVVASNCLYHLCSKSTPGNVNSFGTLSVTYLTAMILSLILFIYIVKVDNVAFELSKINWTSIALGVAVVGLESGYILAYRAGWQLNTASLVANITLAIALIILGTIVYKESLTIKQVFGIVICIIGLILITK